MKHYLNCRALAYFLVLTFFLISNFAFAQFGPNDDLDGDGIVNSLDHDDDNDGIKDPVECNLISGEYAGTFGTAPDPNSPYIRNLENPPSGSYFFSTSGYSSGAYAVINQHSSWHPGHAIWQDLAGHTTGLSDDMYLAVNGSTSVGVFYKQDVALSPDTTYRIGFYAANAQPTATVANNYPVQLGVRLINPITNTVVASAISPNIQSAQTWVKVEIPAFTTPSTPVTYRYEVYNVYTSAAGNDFALDDFYFDGCPDTDGDGIIDYQDLDSDNDGCPDSFESENYDPSMLNPDGSLNCPVNMDSTSPNYGVPICANDGAGYSPGSSKDPDIVGLNCQSCSPDSAIFVDTDLDGIGNDCDLDSDNDGVLNSDELYCDQPLVANSVSGSGMYQDQIYIFNWTDPVFADGIQDGDSQTFNLADGTDITAEFSNVSGFGNYYVPSELNTWSGSKLWQMYNTAGTKDAFYQSADPYKNVAFTVHFTATKNGHEFPLELLALDAEATNTPEQSNFITNGQPWKLLESSGDGGTFTGSGTNHLVDSSTLYGTSIYSSFNSTTLEFYDLPYGKNAIAFGIRLICDTDNDGIPNYLDLDSDGDNCPDSSEAGVWAYAESNNLGAIFQDASTENPTGTVELENSQLLPSNGGDLIGPDNGFYDALESASSPGVYNGTYDFSTILDPAIHNCVCYKPGSGTASTTKVGISTLNRSKNDGETQWPENMSSAYLALDSHEKGFVLTRLSEAQIMALSATEGMLVYDTTNDCLKLYDGTQWFCLVQTCNDHR